MKLQLLNFATVVGICDGTVAIQETNTADGLNQWSSYIYS